jgi:hypothetical protein
MPSQFPLALLQISAPDIRIRQKPHDYRTAGLLRWSLGDENGHQLARYRRPQPALVVTPWGWVGFFRGVG